MGVLEEEVAVVVEGVARTRVAVVLVADEDAVGLERREVEEAREEVVDLGGIEPEMEERTAWVGRVVVDAAPLVPAVGARVEEAREDRRGARVVPVPVPVLVEEVVVVGLRRGARPVAVAPVVEEDRGFLTRLDLAPVVETGAFLVAGAGGVGAEGSDSVGIARRVSTRYWMSWE